MRTHTVIRLLTAALLGVGALSLAACGGDDPGTTATDGKNAAQEAGLKFAECMRENGVDMPDPSSRGGRQKLEIGPGGNASRETFEAAQKACEKHMENVKPAELSDEEQQEFKEAALAHARCIREHGIENFPDPTFGENGQASIRIGKGSGIDREDLEEAEKACEDEMPKDPDKGTAQ